MKKIFLLLIFCIVFFSCNKKVDKSNENTDKIETINTDDIKLDYAILFEKAISEYNEGLEKYDKNEYIKRLNTIDNLFKKDTANTHYSDSIQRMIRELTRLKGMSYKQIEEEKTKRKNSQINNAVSNLIAENDKISGVTWYSCGQYKHNANTNLISVYIGRGEYSVWLRLKMSYTGSDWIFFDSAYLSYSGYTQKVEFNEYEDKKTEIGNARVWEWIDIKVEDEDLLKALRNIPRVQDAQMRLSGKYSKTRTITKKECDGIRDVIQAYDKLVEIFN